MAAPAFHILFVCMGNICRSPTAEAVMRRLVVDAGLESEFSLASAGTGAWHAGQRPDTRAQAAAALRGLELTGRARSVTDRDFVDFDLILAVDDDNLSRLKELAPPDATATIRKLADEDVPDPYYGGASGFDDVFDQIEAACRKLLAELRA
ncbi:low molecular weight protein-tyrosine-phosphatase [Jatrophihabitans sp.]|uniref:low molecular weight protein-tyrosine-phosphatase n=1 Tax=Jatrophihabitans sp. TaxID=1932789 RepID=UPI0030C695B9